MSRFLAAVLFLLLAVPQSLAQDLPAERIRGLWIVQYLDRELGSVAGRAFIDETGGVEIVYVDPRDKTSHVLRGRTEPRAGGIRIVLRGDIASDPAWRAPLPEIRIPAPAQGGVTLALGESRGTAAIAAPPPAPDEIELLLALSPDDLSLSGRWRHAVNPSTGRLDSGRGRVWDFALRNDGTGAAEMTGVETWSRPEARPVLAFPLEDQFATTYAQADYPEPFGADGRLTKPIADRRLIAFFGRDLPREYRDGIRLESLDEGITYSIYRMAWDFARAGADQWPRRRAFEMLERRLGRGIARRFEDHDLVILDARIAKGVVPGPKTFRLNGAEAAWHLNFGDWSGRFSISRDLGFNQSEAADVVVPGETIFVEVRLDRELPIDAFPMLIAVGGTDGRSLRYVLFGGKRAHYLARDPEEPRRYISEPIEIVDPEYLPLLPRGSRAIAVLPGEKILALPAGDPVLRLRPSLAEAAVIQSPRHFSAYLTGDPSARGRTWSDAVKAAASCSGASAPDIDSLSDRQADEYSDTIVSSVSTGLWDGEPSWWTTLSTRVKVGEFAGAIFLRDTLVDLLRRKHGELRRGLDDDGVAGFRELIAADVFGQFAALTSIEVDAPGGGRIPYALTFSDARLKADYGLEGAALERFKTLSTIQARARYGEAVGKTIEETVALGDCDLDALLKITGFHLGPVRQVARQMALRLEPVPLPGGNERPRFVADRRARAWIDRVEIVATALAEQKAIQKLDNAILMVAAGVAALPLALSEAPGALVAMFLIDTADLVLAGYDLGANLREVASETRFAVGASALLGPRLYDEATARRYEWVAHYFGVVAAGMGATYSFIDSGLYAGIATRAMQWAPARLSAPVRWTSAASGNAWTVERAQALLARFRTAADAGDMAQLRRLALDLPLEERVAVIEMMREAGLMAARVGGGALEAHEAAALAIARAIDDAASTAARPAWARALGDELYRRIGFRAGAPHVAELFQANPQGMAQLLATPGAEHLLTQPWSSFDQFAAEVARLRNRAPPRPQEFYYQMTGAAPDPPGLHIEGGFIARGPEPQGRVDFQVNRGTGNVRIGDYTRTIEPDDTLNTGGLMLELSYARIDTVGNPDLAWIRGFPYPLTERGVPLGMYMNLRVMNAAGISFADPRLTVVKFSYIVSVNTCVELQWMRNIYPGAPLGELFRATHSFRYAQNFLEQAGYRIDDVVVQAAAGAQPIRTYVDDFFEGTDIDAFLARYGLGQDDRIPFGHDVYMRVAPR